jgi:membrane-associated protease RseP (regulator of RpoE activity)
MGMSLADEYKRVSFQWGILMVRTRRGLSLMDRFGRFRVTKPLAWFMLVLMPIAAGISLFLILQTVSVYLSPLGSGVIDYVRSITPLANLLLPGINPYIPIVYGWLAIVVAVVVHEASHGIVARSLGVPIKSAGVVFLLLIPIGAFVEIDDEVLKAAKARNATRILAAGPGTNFVLALVCLALLILLVSVMVPVAKGAGVIALAEDTPQLHSPALLAGVKAGDVIMKLNDAPVTDINQTLRASGTFQIGQIVTITIWRNGETILLSNVTLGKIVVLDTRTNQTTTYPYLGVVSIGYQDLKDIVSAYSTFYTKNPLLYFAVTPTYPSTTYYVPFSNVLQIFYTSPFGLATHILANILFWLFFVNINVAIFNSLPIYPLDGGQAFESLLGGAGQKKISKESAHRITIAVTMVVLMILLAVIVGPYLTFL